MSDVSHQIITSYWAKTMSHVFVSYSLHIAYCININLSSRLTYCYKLLILTSAETIIF